MSAKLKKGIFSNFIGTGASGLLTVAMIPVYVRLMGSQEWGIVATSLTLQMFFTIFDSGFSQILSRDVAQNTKNKNISYFSFLLIYFIFALVVFCILQLSINVWVENWISVSKNNDIIGVTARIVAVQLFFQLLNCANNGYWQGAQQQEVLNFRLVFFMVCKHLSTFIFVYFFNAPPAITYAICFSFFSMIEFLLNFYFINSLLNMPSRCEIKEHFKSIKSELTIISIAFIIGAIVSQVDRFALSRILPTSEFGLYVATLSIALATLQFQYPITRAFLPMLASGGLTKLQVRKYGLLLGFFCSIPSLIGIVFSKEICILVTHISTPSLDLILNTKLIFASTAINGFANIILCKIVASKDARYITFVNLINLFVSLCIAYLFAFDLGVVTSGLIWMTTTSIQLFLYLYWSYCEKNKK